MRMVGCVLYELAWPVGFEGKGKKDAVVISQKLGENFCICTHIRFCFLSKQSSSCAAVIFSDIYITPLYPSENKAT